MATHSRCWHPWKAVVVGAALALIGALAPPWSARAADSRGVHLLFTQQDVVQAFDLTTGKGYQVGTATGAISGTTFVDFQYAPAGPPVGEVLPIVFHSTVIVTDIDGDQLFFDNDGTGSFHLGVPGFDFRGTGGPLTGTYVVTGGTGKYHEWAVGSTYTHRAIVANPPSPPERLGSVYGEVSYVDLCPQPSLRVTVSPETLWPPNHKYVLAHATLAASRDITATTLVSVTSNEPDTGVGDGDTSNDIVILNGSTFNLRAERSGTGTGRLYTITYQATNGCGAATTATATVAVPLNRSQ
jgi:hypothetical protein